MEAEPLEHKQVVHGGHGQHRHALLLPQHASRRAAQPAQHPGPAAPGHGPRTGVPAESAVSCVAEKRQQEEEGGAHVRPPHHTRHRLCVDGVRGEEQARQQAPGSSAQQGAGQGREEGGDQCVEGQVEQVVAPWAQAVQGVVEAEGEGAEGPEGLVAAAVGQHGAPEVVVQDVGPRRLREEILVGLDGATAKHRTND